MVESKEKIDKMNRMNTNILLGLTGHPASGKDTVAEYLVTKHGFVHVSLGDIIREYTKEHNLGGLDRDNLREMGVFIREKFGAGYLTTLALQKGHPKLIITGVRTIREAEGIKENGGSIIALRAPIEFRYKNSVERGRADEKSFEKFKELEEKEARGTDPNAQNVEGVMSMADYTIQNEGKLEDLYSKIDIIVEEICGLQKA